MTSTVQYVLVPKGSKLGAPDSCQITQMPMSQCCNSSNIKVLSSIFDWHFKKHFRYIQLIYLKYPLDYVNNEYAICN